MAPRAITEEEKQTVKDLVARARIALKEIADYDQAKVDRLIQAVGWALSNEKTFTRLSNMGVDESGLGDRAGRPNKRFKLHGILRDALRAKSMGIVEEDRERIFDPFFTTKESGTGLGLAIALNIVTQHGGALSCRANTPRGSIFRMELPGLVETL